MTCTFANADCFGRIQRHHVIRKNRLKIQFPYGALETPDGWKPAGRYHLSYRHPEYPYKSLNQIKADERNLLNICTFHHEQLEAHRIYLTEIPESVKDFARDYGLEGWLERYTQVEATRLVGLENARRRVCPSEYGNG